MIRTCNAARASPPGRGDARRVRAAPRAGSARWALALGAALLLLFHPGHAGATQPPEDDDEPVEVDAQGTYLRPNIRDRDGTWAYIHVTPADMPWRVAVPRPREPARDGGTRRVREVAVEAMQLWEEALQPEVPWFALEFVERDPDAPVQVEWVRGRSAGGGALGRGWIAARIDEAGQLRVGGGMRLSMRPHLAVDRALTLDQVRLLVAHEFGHVLGLGHCLACDSIMNYEWETRERALVTPLDVATFLALVDEPNGLRMDGRLLEGLAGAR